MTTRVRELSYGSLQNIEFRSVQFFRIGLDSPPPCKTSKKSVENLIVENSTLFFYFVGVFYCPSNDRDHTDPPISLVFNLAKRGEQVYLREGLRDTNVPEPRQMFLLRGVC